jgi:hypothetical protein
MPTKGASLGNQQKVEATITIAPQGLTKTDLMGELGHLLALPVYQLALPFTHEAWRQLEYRGILSSTTTW